MPKELSKYDRRIEDALLADDKWIKDEEAAKKALEDAKKTLKPPDDRNIVRSEQPVWVEDEKLANYMHDNRNEDGFLRPYLAWRYMLRQLGVSGTDIVAVPWPNDVDNERAYPLLNCERHGHDIWMHQAQSNVTPQLPSTVTPGHLNFMFSKMARTLKSDLLIVRQKSVTWCVELLRVPDNRARCIAAGLLPILANMIPETDLYIRQQLALCFNYASAAIQTWNDLVELGCIRGLIEMLQTDDAVLRCNALDALNVCALSCEVRDSIVNDSTTLATIVSYLAKDTDSGNVCHAMDLCSRCMGSLNYCQKAIDQVLGAGGLPIVVQLAKTIHPPMMVSCGRFICLVGFDEKGRKQAVQLGAVKVFIPYLDHVENRIMAYGTAVLLSLTLEIKGKKDFILANGVPLMTPMIHLTDGELTFLAMNLIINVTEDPAARAKVQHGIQICRTLILQTLNGTLKKYARQTIQELQFTSRPYQNLRDGGGDGMRWKESVWQWVTKSAEVYMEGLPRKAFINSLTNCLKEYPQLHGREVVVVQRIEELCQSGVERHAALAVDNRASTHLQIACLVQGTYQTLLPWFRNDHEKVIEIIRKPVGESSAAAVGVAQRIALLLSFDKFRLVSRGLKHMEADFGKAFVVEHYEKPDFHRARIRRCLYHSVFSAEGNPELTPIFCALDSMWFDQLKPHKHGVEFQRPTTLARGNQECNFLLRRIPRGGMTQGQTQS